MRASAPAYSRPAAPGACRPGRGGLAACDGLIRTFSSSGSHESRVRDRTLEQWTPRLLDREEAG